MSSSESDSETQFSVSSGKHDSKFLEERRICFINSLKKNEVVMKRSVASGVMKEKETAWTKIKEEYEKTLELKLLLGK